LPALGPSQRLTVSPVLKSVVISSPEFFHGESSSTSKATYRFSSS